MKSLLTVLVLAGHCLYAGIMFGWASLQLILEEEGVMRGGCDPNEDNCASQNEKFQLVYTVTTTLFMLGAFISGFLVDLYGPTKMAAVSGILITAAMLFLALADPLQDALFVLSGACMGFGGSLAYLNGFPLGSVVDERHLSIVMTSLNCLYDASASVFLLFYYLYHDVGLSRKVLFVSFACLAFALYGGITVLWAVHEPELHAKFASTVEGAGVGGPAAEDCSPSALQGGAAAEGKENRLAAAVAEGGTNEEKELAMVAMQGDASTAVEGDADTRDNSPQPTSTLLVDEYSAAFAYSQPWYLHLRQEPFIFITILASIQILRNNTYFGIVLEVLTSLNDADSNYLYTKIFFLLLPLSFVFIPVVDYVLVNYGMLWAFHVTTACGLVQSVTNMVPVLEVQVVTFVFFCAFRAFLFSLLGSFFVKMYGSKNSGRMFGTMSIIASCVNFLQYPAYILVTEYDNGDLFYINLVLLLLCPVCFVVVEGLFKPILLKYSFVDTKIVAVEGAADEKKDESPSYEAIVNI